MARPPRALRRTGAALVAVVALGHPPPLRAADADPWFGHDKVLHFEATASLAIVGYAGAAMVTTDRPTRVGAGAALALGAGIGKELWDLDGRGDASWRDLTWDLIGATTGVLLAAAIDWSIHRIFDWPVGPRSR